MTPFSHRQSASGKGDHESLEPLRAIVEAAKPLGRHLSLGVAVI